MTASGVAVPRRRLLEVAITARPAIWLTAIVAASALIRFAASRGYPGPWILPDELIYAELARSLAEHGHMTIRDAPSPGFGPVYPLLIAPAYLIFDRLPEAYASVKAINAVAMSLAAVPAYFLARRLLAPPLSILVAFLTVAVPSMAYTGLVMTENAFYPVAVLAMLAIVRVLERRTLRREVVALALLGLALATRVQAVALVAALATAIVIAALLETWTDDGRLSVRPLFRRVAAFWVTWAVLVAGLFGVILVQAARGRPLTAVFGAYEGAANQTYDYGALPRWVLYHLAEFDLYLGVFPFIALGVVLLRAFTVERRSPAVRAFAAASISIVFWMTLLVATFSTQPLVGYVEERYLFYVAPLFFVALAVWIDRGLPRTGRGVWTFVIIAAALPGILPLYSFVPTSIENAHTLALMPLFDLRLAVVRDFPPGALVVIAGIIAALVVVYLPSRWRLVLPLIVALYFAAAARPIHAWFQARTSGSLGAGIQTRRDWIDNAVGSNADVPVVWSGAADLHVMFDNEFFNRSVRTIYDLAPPPPGNLHLVDVASTVDPRTGAILGAGGKRVDAPYALTDRTTILDGTPVARDPNLGTTLYRVRNPVALSSSVSGLYANDTWSTGTVGWTRYRCNGGSVLVDLENSPALFPAGQKIAANVDGRTVATAKLTPAAPATTLKVPLRPSGGRCAVTFTVSPTAVPAQVLGAADPDPRALGARFLGFRYRR